MNKYLKCSLNSAIEDLPVEDARKVETRISTNVKSLIATLIMSFQS